MKNLTCVPNYTQIYFLYSTVMSACQGSGLADTWTVSIFRTLMYMQTHFRPTSKTSLQIASNALFSVRNFKTFSAVSTFSVKDIPATPTHFPISSKLYFAHATPLVKDFARMQPIRLKLPIILDSNNKC